MISEAAALRPNYLSLLYAVAGRYYVTPEKAMHEVMGQLQKRPNEENMERVRHKWTPEIAGIIAELKADGMTWQEIANEIGACSANAAYLVYKRYGGDLE